MLERSLSFNWKPGSISIASQLRFIEGLMSKRIQPAERRARCDTDIVRPVASFPILDNNSKQFNVNGPKTQLWLLSRHTCFDPQSLFWNLCLSVMMIITVTTDCTKGFAHRSHHLILKIGGAENCLRHYEPFVCHRSSNKKHARCYHWQWTWFM